MWLGNDLCIISFQVIVVLPEWGATIEVHNLHECFYNLYGTTKHLKEEKPRILYTYTVSDPGFPYGGRAPDCERMQH